MILLVLQSVLLTAAATTVRNVYWNTTTASLSRDPITVIVNQGNLPWEYDQVNLICPVVGEAGEEEQHVIYSVEKEEFESCRVSSPRPRIVAVCNRPRTFMYFTITFRSFTPTPGALEFSPGKEYYFISTSTNKDIHRRAGGWCRSHNMKMIFKVAESETELEYRENQKKSTTFSPIPSPAAFWSKYKLRGDQLVSENSENNYHQTDSETYFSDKSSQIYEYRSVLDNSLDISIAARSDSSASSNISTSYCWTVLSSVLLLSSWRL